MGETTKIQWCDHTASPWHGCSKVAAGCDNCYAARQAVRNPGTLGIWGDYGTRIKSKSFIKNLRLWNEQAKREGRIASVFPSICDPFEDRPELAPWRDEMFAAIDELPNVRLLLLTKRPQNILRMWAPRESTPRFRMPRHNVWLIASVACQADADRDIPELLKCRDLSPVLGASAEPLIGPIKFRAEWLIDPRECSCYEPEHGHQLGCVFHGMTLAEVCEAMFGPSPSLDWIIAGGESGPRGRECDLGWIRSIVEQCRYLDVPCFVKQLGSKPYVDHSPPEAAKIARKHGVGPLVAEFLALDDAKGGDWIEWPEDLRVREFPEPI